MAITFEKTPLEWQNPGTEPSTALKANGFSAGYKPAASTFNYQISNTSECLTELQTKLSDLDGDAIKGVKGNGTTINPSSTGIVNITPNNIGAATSTHYHNASQITSGTLPIERGGTGATTIEKAKEILGIESGGVGKSLKGQTVAPTSDTTVTAGTGAEIFNDYSTRTYSSSGSVSKGNIASGGCSHAEGYGTTASGNYSHAEGYKTIATQQSSHAEGSETTASGNSSHAEGYYTTASGKQSHAEGNRTTASGDYSHAEGYETTASGSYSHAGGENTIASGARSFAFGYGTQALETAACALGWVTKAESYQLAIGYFNEQVAGYNSGDGKGNLFVIGAGTETYPKNVFRVYGSSGQVYGGTYSNSGADYAEYFEWLDENPYNEDRRGFFVTLDGDKIRKATDKDEYILGVVSATPTVIGDSQSENWGEMYLKDVFGENLIEVVEVEETTDEHGNIIPARTEQRWILNPDYDSSLPYESREDRKEWSAIGLMGKLVVIDDGTCQENGYCKPNENGIATASETGYRVMKRLDENHVRIVLK